MERKRWVILILIIVVISLLPIALFLNTYDNGAYSLTHLYDKSPALSVSVNPGPSYATAASVGIMKWHSGKQVSVLNESSLGTQSDAGSLSLTGLPYASTTVMNVLELNITNTGSSAATNVSFRVGVVGNFPNGSTFVTSNSINPGSSNNVTWKAFTKGSYTYYTFNFNLGAHSTRNLFISFHLPPSNLYSKSDAYIWYQVSTNTNSHRWW